MKSHYSAAELAGLALPGLPRTERGMRMKADGCGWAFQEVSGRGGRNGTRREYAITALPAEARIALLNAAIGGTPALPAAPLPPAPANMWAAAGLSINHDAKEYDHETPQTDLHSLGATAPAGAVRPALPRPARDDPPAQPVTQRPGDQPALQPGTGVPAASGLDAAPLRLSEADDADAGQRQSDRARARIAEFVHAFPGSVPAAIDHLNAQAIAGTLPGPLRWALEHAWDKRRADSRLNVSTFNKWQKVKQQRGSFMPAKRHRDMEVKPWYGLLLALRQRPQGSCYTWIAAQIAAQWQPGWGAEPPSYHAIRRVCVDKLSALDQLKGRLTGSALRAHKHWHPRTADGLAPAQEVHADGWNTHFTAPHPLTGEFVTYEVWHFHDVATRYVPPPGIGLTETYEVVTAGLERCVRALGMIAILQTDSTKVIKRSPRFTADPFAALSERAGFVTVHPKEVGNSQANGICENFNSSWLDKCSRELATYQGKGMDGLTLKRVKKLTERMVRADKAGDLALRDRLKAEAEKVGKGRVFTSYAEAEAWINAKVEQFNDRPHRSLPKVADPVTGRQRHQTPREALQQAIADGWQPVALSEAHLVDLFRPHVRCKVTREAISPVGNGQRYHHTSLGAWNGQEVMAAVDPMDWRSVWVKELSGELICVADLVTATGYRAKTSYEIAEEKRAAAQMKRLGKKGDLVKARTGLSIAAPAAEQIVIGGRVLDADLTRLPPEPAPRVTTPAPVPVEAAAVTPPAAPPIVRSLRPPADNYADWCEIDRRLLDGEPVSDDELRWHESYQRSAQFRTESRKGKAAA